MTARVMTAWFRISRPVLAHLLSPDLLVAADTHRARLRFYDAHFRSAGANTPQRLREGRFREAVIAVEGEACGRRGEVSLFMWTDSEPYLAWGREVFGWPLQRSDIKLDGEAWSQSLHAGLRGSALAHGGGGEVRADDIQLGERIRAGRSSAWLTPRRIPRRGGLVDDERELLIVRPAVRKVGRWHRASCRVHIHLPDFGLESLYCDDASGEVVDGMQLSVPGSVEVS